MKTEYSLMALLKDDPDIAGFLTKKKEAVKRDKQNLVSAAKLYTQKYENEIQEGTKLRQKLLTEGKSQGKSEDEVLSSYGQFLPSVYTPILNWLFFSFREETTEQSSKMKLEELTQYYIEKLGYEGFIKKLEEGNTYAHDGYDELDDILSDDTEEPEEMDKFIYGNLTNSEFQKLKKLKALSKSDNPKEAFAAYKKCLELCKRFNLEFDKIPCKY